MEVRQAGMDAQVFVSKNMDGFVILCQIHHQLLSQQLFALEIVEMVLFKLTSYATMEHQQMELDASLIAQDPFLATYVEEVL